MQEKVEYDRNMIERSEKEELTSKKSRGEVPRNPSRKYRTRHKWV
jgi:hypothetical protein